MNSNKATPPVRKFHNYTRLNRLSRKVFTPVKKSEKPPPRQRSPSVQEEKYEDDVIDITDSPTKDDGSIDYNVPDRSKGDYYCRLCESHMNTMMVWQTHVIGKRHLKNLEKGPSGIPSKQKFEASANSEPMILERLNKITFPVVGLDHVAEFRRQNSTDPSYTCFLCQGTQPLSQFGAHLISTKHRLNYIRQVDPDGDQLITALRLKGDALDNVVEEHASQLEQKFGRGKIEVKVEKKSDKDRVFWSAKKKKNNDYRDDNRSRSPTSYNRRSPSPLPRRRSPSPLPHRRSPSPLHRQRSPLPSHHRRSPSPLLHRRSPLPSYDQSRSPNFRREPSPKFQRNSPPSFRREPIPHPQSSSPWLQSNLPVDPYSRMEEERMREIRHSQLEPAYPKEDFLRRIDPESQNPKILPHFQEPTYRSNYFDTKVNQSVDFGYRREQLPLDVNKQQHMYHDPVAVYQRQEIANPNLASSSLIPPTSMRSTAVNALRRPESISTNVERTFGTYLDPPSTSHTQSSTSASTYKSTTSYEQPIKIPSYDESKEIPKSTENEVLEMINFYKWASLAQTALQKPKTIMERLSSTSPFEQWCILFSLTKIYTAQPKEIPMLLEIFIQVNKKALNHSLLRSTPEEQLGVTLKLLKEKTENEFKHNVENAKKNTGYMHENQGALQTSMANPSSMKNVLQNPQWFSVADARKTQTSSSANNVKEIWTRLTANPEKEKTPEPKLPRRYRLVNYPEDDDDGDNNQASDLINKRNTSRVNVFDSRYK